MMTWEDSKVAKAKLSRLDSGTETTMTSETKYFEERVHRVQQSALDCIEQRKLEALDTLDSEREAAIQEFKEQVDQEKVAEWILVLAAIAPVLLLPMLPVILAAAVYLSLNSTLAVAVCCAYVAYVWLDCMILRTHLRGGRPVRSLRRESRLLRYGAEYFPVSLVRDRGNGTVLTVQEARKGIVEVEGDKWQTVDQNGSFLFVIHPHGVLGQGVWNSFSSESIGFHHLFPFMGFRVATLNLNFYLPLFRDFLLMQGFVSAGKESLLSYLGSKCPSRTWEMEEGKTARGLGLVVGGAEESFLSDPGRNSLVLRKRKGFVRYALQSGAYLVPVYCFKQNYIYKQLKNPLLQKLQRFLKRYLSFAPILFAGRFLLLPFKETITTVVGQPIRLPKIPHPTPKDVSHYHSLYIDGLQKLFNDYKDKYDSTRKEELTFMG